MEKPLEILDLPEDVRRLVGACELTGKRTVFSRNGRPIAALISYDEYLALQETLAISNDAALRAAIDAAEEQAKRGAILAVEDLIEGGGMRDEG
jgi:PHD/YefM family antitoxin component YafN of YafNO toxin-antitoxin module